MPGGAPLIACLLRANGVTALCRVCEQAKAPSSITRQPHFSRRGLHSISICLGFPEKKNICTCPAWLSTSRAPAAARARSRSSERTAGRLQQREAGGLHAVLLLSVLQQRSFCSPGSVLPGIAAKGRRGKQH